MRGVLLTAVVVLFVGVVAAAASAENALHWGDPQAGSSLGERALCSS